MLMLMLSGLHLRLRDLCIKHKHKKKKSFLFSYAHAYVALVRVMLSYAYAYIYACCGYKKAAKAIANRIKMVIPKLINSDQTGFLKGRFIGDNTRLLDSIIKHTSENNIPGLLLSIDFEKSLRPT